MARSTEHTNTPALCRRGLREIGWSQRRAAFAIEMSPALVSMVLAKPPKAKSQPCLDKLATLIAAVRNDDPVPA